MTELVNITQTIDPNEKVWRFAEVTKQSPGSRGFHRYELFSVNRDGKLAVYERDMGPASKFKGAKRLWQMLAFFEHTVDECRAYAQRDRYETYFDVKDRFSLESYKVA
ncbi:hypothetical protein LCGC14_2078930 [marine sediment metagenome]|uniref:Uncharacterized protein n=1 Tax=marine sediment metagenome TaxID=412755 RepID=A0A0F9EG16_9ZZZZ